MISVRELRIGNWILNVKGKPFEICYVSDLAAIDSPEIVNGVSLEYNPINLTTGILENSGFTKSYDEIFNLTFYDLGNVSICSLEGEFTLSGQKMPPMKYVHQLQNLVFILRGEELTINL
jgi:hypothetical protein